MTKSLGLSTARWQAIGAVSLAHRPLTVPQIARSMGLQRQSVQRTINVLLDDGLVETVDNPDHQRARLVVLTDKGKTAFEKAIAIQMKWAEGLGAGLASSDLETALSALRTLRARLETPRGSRARQQSSQRSRAGERPK